MRFVRGASFAVRHCGLAIAAVLVGSASVGVASAAGARIADWGMNEGPNATTMHDSGPFNIPGRIGSAVETGVVADGRTVYRWAATGRDGVRPERLVTVESDRLNPRRADFVVVVRFKTGFRSHQHIMQKGQSGAAGGMWKIPMKYGRVGCTFVGSRDMAGIWSRETGLWDGQWHRVRCERSRAGVTITVDGGQPKTNHKWTGRIVNTWPTAIGGKPRCNVEPVHCDYYVGLINRVVVKKLR
jgi:hypothetical protein